MMQTWADLVEEQASNGLIEAEIEEPF